MSDLVRTPTEGGVSRYIPACLYFVGVFHGLVGTIATFANDDPMETRYFASGAFFIAWAAYHRIMQRRAPSADEGGV